MKNLIQAPKKAVQTYRLLVSDNSLRQQTKFCLVSTAMECHFPKSLNISSLLYSCESLFGLFHYHQTQVHHKYTYGFIIRHLFIIIRHRFIIIRHLSNIIRHKSIVITHHFIIIKPKFYYQAPIYYQVLAKFFRSCILHQHFSQVPQGGALCGKLSNTCKGDTSSAGDTSISIPGSLFFPVRGCNDSRCGKFHYW